MTQTTNALRSVPDNLSAVLHVAHVGDIQGGLGTIRRGDTDKHRTLRHRLQTLLAILGPGLIVIVSANDAGTFGTYMQSGQQYGTSPLWT